VTTRELLTRTGNQSKIESGMRRSCESAYGTCCMLKEWVCEVSNVFPIDFSRHWYCGRELCIRLAAWSNTWRCMDLVMGILTATGKFRATGVSQQHHQRTKRKKERKGLTSSKMQSTQSLALAPPTSCLALSLSSLRSIFPIALLGISSMNATPPLSCL
jgi:hypothetical protein